MSVPQRIGEHRPTIVLAILVTCCLISLASGSRGVIVGTGVRIVAEIVSIPFLSVFHRLQQGGTYVAGLVTAYDDALLEAHGLRQRLGYMMGKEAERVELLAENQRLRGMLGFERESASLELLAANVIQHASGILTIDRGSYHGIRESLCVISEEGVVGMVTQVGLFTSNVITLQNPMCKIDAMVQRNRVRGRVHGSASDLESTCTMHYIDLKDDIREGDIVVTSPDSVFPSGYPIGRVGARTGRGQLSQSAEIIPEVDPFSTDEVFILLGYDQDWSDMAEQADAQPIAKRDPIGLEETRTIQERFAP
ncbi:MAG: rod shape-determining protein MreC [Candidatus Hydrogenedentes bacterium]|nr:rod shape-determining protein MreC [Candidatus Hydrogenedentota bacterium]